MHCLHCCPTSSIFFNSIWLIIVLLLALNLSDSMHCQPPVTFLIIAIIFFIKQFSIDYFNLRNYINCWTISFFAGCHFTNQYFHTEHLLICKFVWGYFWCVGRYISDLYHQLHSHFFLHVCFIHLSCLLELRQNQVYHQFQTICS